MAARTTMATLITALRGFTNAGTADFTIAGTAYWSDEQLQTILDRFCTRFIDAELVAHPQQNSENVTEWKEYSTYFDWLETTSEGTSRFIVTDGLGGVISADDYTVNYEVGIITFTEDQAGLGRYLTGFSYDIYAAAAEVWEQKAAQYATMIDFSTDNHSVKRSHIVAQCEKMIDKYKKLSKNSGSASVQVMRGDFNE